MILRATTETGSVYEIDVENQFWRKNNGPSERIWTMKSIPELTQPTTLGELMKRLETVPDVEVPVVGERLYISGKDEWAFSTVIVSVEEVEA